MTTAPTPEEVRELAAELDTYTAFDPGNWPCHKAADMLRGLQADNERLRAELEARKPLPLSDEAVVQLYMPWDYGLMDDEAYAVIRAVERAHGITGGSS